MHPQIVNSWQELENIHDVVEQMVYPLETDDDYDRGKINEYKSQINHF